MKLSHILVALSTLAVVSSPVLANDKPAKDAKPAATKDAKPAATKDAKPAAKDAAAKPAK